MCKGSAMHLNNKIPCWSICSLAGLKYVKIAASHFVYKKDDFFCVHWSGIENAYFLFGKRHTYIIISLRISKTSVVEHFSMSRNDV